MERSRNKGLVGLWTGDLVSTISSLTVWPYELPEVISFLGCKICKMRWSILGLCLGETLPIKIWSTKYSEHNLELVLTKIAITFGSFGSFFNSLSPCISDCKKIRAALSVFGAEKGVRGPSPVLVSYNRSLGGQAPRNAGSLLILLQTPAPSATNLLENKLMWKLSFAFCV